MRRDLVPPPVDVHPDNGLSVDRVSLVRVDGNAKESRISLKRKNTNTSFYKCHTSSLLWLTFHSNKLKKKTKWKKRKKEGLPKMFCHLSRPGGLYLCLHGLYRESRSRQFKNRHIDSSYALKPYLT